MRRAIQTITVTATVFRNDKGFFARAVELPIVSTPAARTQRGALKNLTIAVGFWLTDMSVEGMLVSALDEAGFRLGIDSRNLEVHIYDSKPLTVPLYDVRKKDAKRQFKDSIPDHRSPGRGVTHADSTGDEKKERYD